MRVILMILSLLISSKVLALDEVTEFSYNDDMKVEKIVMSEQILLNDLMKLHNDYDFEGERMIAGKHEKKKNSKNSYLNNLRSRLEGTKNLRL